ncbi:LysM peptidoglycan-binding domain-containing protein [Patescibacteria group bacterium]|nr:LysM peptidoglycan-binding domain-containing protein [Patescibacteria group bacterium]
MKKYLMFKKLIILCSLFLSFGYTTNAQLSLKYTDKLEPLLLKPGDTSEIYIELMESYGKSTKVNIYTTDGTTTSTGSFAAKLPDRKQYFFGVWAKFDENIIEMEAGEKKKLKLTIHIPETATPGDYSGGIAASRIFEEKTNVEKYNKNISASMSATARIAMPLYFTIEGQRINKLEIGNLFYKEISGGNYTLYLPFQNNGNTTIKITVDPSMKSVFGKNNKILDQKEILLFPREKAKIEIPLGVLPIFGVYDLNTDITYSEHSLLTQKDTLLEKTTKNIRLIIIPWLQIIIFLVLVVIIVTSILHKKAHLAGLIKSSSKYSVQQNDTIAQLAKSNDVDWKTIIKINNIKPPYDIYPRQEILIPKKKE